MKHLAPLFFALALILVACGDDENEYKIGGGGTTTPVNPDPRQDNGPEIAKYSLEFPALKGGNSVVIVHNAKLNDKLNKSGVNYCVEWDTKIHAQRWSCYKLYADNYKSGNKVSRYSASNDGSLSSDCQYPNDPDLRNEYRLTYDPYKGSGYDHGHICPSADRQRAVEANYQTFYITNMQPQIHDFNANIWGDMEEQVRTWAGQFDTLYVCKGGTIDKSEWIIKYLGSGSNKIPVPKYFFMALLGKKGSNFKATGFWIAQDNYSSDKIKNYAVTIQTLQNNTGIDFFCNLPDDIETAVENVSYSQMEKEWTWFN